MTEPKTRAQITYPFVPVPMELIETVSTRALKLWTVLWICAWRHIPPEMEHLQGQMADKNGKPATRRAVQTWLRELERGGWIIWDRRQKAGLRYQVLNIRDRNLDSDPEPDENLDSHHRNLDSDQSESRFSSALDLRRADAPKNGPQIMSDHDQIMIPAGDPSGAAHAAHAASSTDKQAQPEPGRPDSDTPTTGQPPAHPAIGIVRQLTGRQPPPAARATIAARVGASDDELRRWRATINAWQCAGHNPHNIAGMLDWHEKGKPDERRPRGRVEKTHETGRDVAGTPEQDRGIEGYADLPPDERRRRARERNRRAAERRC